MQPTNQAFIIYFFDFVFVYEFIYLSFKTALCNSTATLSKMYSPNFTVTTKLNISTKLNLFLKIHSVFSLLNICESHCKLSVCERFCICVCEVFSKKSYFSVINLSARVSFPYDRLRIRVKQAGCAVGAWPKLRPMFACRHREIETNRSSKSYACDRCIADITKLIIKRNYKVTR